jgi:hypothetical protein
VRWQLVHAKTTRERNNGGAHPFNDQTTKTVSDKNQRSVELVDLSAEHAPPEHLRAGVIVWD